MNEIVVAQPERLQLVQLADGARYRYEAIVRARQLHEVQQRADRVGEADQRVACHGARWRVENQMRQQRQIGDFGCLRERVMGNK